MVVPRWEFICPERPISVFATMPLRYCPDEMNRSWMPNECVPSMRFGGGSIVSGQQICARARSSPFSSTCGGITSVRVSTKRPAGTNTVPPPFAAAAAIAASNASESEASSFDSAPKSSTSKRSSFHTARGAATSHVPASYQPRPPASPLRIFTA